MRPVPELSGQVFGRWTVLKDYILTPRGERKWACRCVCGTERYALRPWQRQSRYYDLRNE